MTGAPAGAWAVDWAQTETDGMQGLGFVEMTIGAEWLWRGDALRLDAPGSVMPLGEALGRAELRRRASRRVARVSGVRPTSLTPDMPVQDLPGDGFAVTDGRRIWCGQWMVPGAHGRCIAVFDRGLPPQGKTLWVVATKRRANRPSVTSTRAIPQLLCGMAEGTLIATPGGWHPIETLCPGSLVLTQDAGPLPVQATTARHVSGVRLRLEPALAPIRVAAGALGPDRPATDVLLSPALRVMVRGGAAQALFGAPEVMVAASDLTGSTAAQDARIYPPHGVTYHALTLGAGPSGPHLVRAAGLWCESLDAAEGSQPYRRPALTRGEAAILASGR